LIQSAIFSRIYNFGIYKYNYIYGVITDILFSICEYVVAIYEKNKDRINNEENKDVELVNNIIPRNKPKKSIEEIREANKIYKQHQREKLKEKYGEEEYKKIRAKEIAKYRA
jgi:hypothetical protein